MITICSMFTRIWLRHVNTVLVKVFVADRCEEENESEMESCSVGDKALGDIEERMKAKISPHTNYFRSFVPCFLLSIVY